MQPRSSRAEAKPSAATATTRETAEGAPSEAESTAAGAVNYFCTLFPFNKFRCFQELFPFEYNMMMPRLVEEPLAEEFEEETEEEAD